MASTLRLILGKAGPFIGLILVIGLFAVPAETREYFLTYHNFKIILTQTVIVSIGALGMTLIIVSGAIDLSVGSTVALSGVVAALLIQRGWGAAATALASIGVGGLVGLLNGAAVAGLRMPSFIITLGMLGIGRGMAKWLANNQTVDYDASPINSWMTTANPSGYALPPGVWVAIALAVATSLLLRKTVFGRHVFALGSNEAAALTPFGPEVVIIGGASLNGGSGTILGSVIGALIMSVLRNGSQQMGWPNYFQEIIIGLVIIVAVFIDRFRRGTKA